MRSMQCVTRPLKCLEDFLTSSFQTSGPKKNVMRREIMCARRASPMSILCVDKGKGGGRGGGGQGEVGERGEGNSKGKEGGEREKREEGMKRQHRENGREMEKKVGGNRGSTQQRWAIWYQKYQYDINTYRIDIWFLTNSIRYSLILKGICLRTRTITTVV